MSFDAFGESLLHKNVYYICHTDYENEKNLIGDLSLARQRFFQNNRKTLRFKYENNEMGYSENITAVFKKKHFSWDRIVGKLRLEEVFYVKHHFILVQRDFNSNIIAKVYYDKFLTWVKTEYCNPVDSDVVLAIIEPVVTEDAIDLFTLNVERNIYDKQTLHPVLSEKINGKQSVLNSMFETPKIVAVIDGDEYSYCNREEQLARLEVTDRSQELNQYLSSFNDERAREDKDIKFEKLDDEDLVLSVLNEDVKEEPRLVNILGDFDQSNETEVTDEIELANEAEVTSEINVVETIGNNTVVIETTEDENEIAVIKIIKQHVSQDEANIQEKPILKQGFDVSYNKDKQIEYVGNWVNGQKNGLGITHRKGDNATKISLYKNGVSSNKIAIFDINANLNFLGTVDKSKKTGISISYNKIGNTYHVAKNVDNMLIRSSVFDTDGNLIYFGETKNGLKHGKGTTFDTDGNVIESGIYDKGRFVM